jgi:cell division protein ZapD
MIRVQIEQDDLIPEISANKHMLWIRFLQNSITSKPQPVTANISFAITLCNL